MIRRPGELPPVLTHTHWASTMVGSGGRLVTNAGVHPRRQARCQHHDRPVPHDQQAGRRHLPRLPGAAVLPGSDGHGAQAPASDEMMHNIVQVVHRVRQGCALRTRLCINKVGGWGPRGRDRRSVLQGESRPHTHRKKNGFLMHKVRACTTCALHNPVHRAQPMHPQKISQTFSTLVHCTTSLAINHHLFWIGG